MCLAEPGRVSAIDGEVARVVTVGGPLDVSLSLLTSQQEPIEVGDWVLIALGLALQVIPDDDVPVLLNEQRLLHEVGGSHGG